MTGRVVPTTTQRKMPRLSFAMLRDAGILLGLFLIFAVFSLLSPYFLTEQNLINVLQQSSINGCIAVGMTLVIIAGGIDLSVGSTAALAAVVSASLHRLRSSQLDWWELRLVSSTALWSPTRACNHLSSPSEL
jgi:ribose transport system permease protein